MRQLKHAALALALATAACADVNHSDIGGEISILVKYDNELVAPAIERLAAYRRAAIPQIETAMHTAAPNGRQHLIAALERIGDEEAVPVLRHVAIFDITPDVRTSAEGLLQRWSGEGTSPRATRSRAALVEVARKRAAGLGPLLFGDTGMPGVPSTVGAIPPVGPPEKP